MAGPPAAGPPSADPRAEYLRRRERHQAAVAAAERLDGIFSTVRGVVFLAGAVTAYVAWGPGALRPAWVWLPALLFAALLYSHERVVARLAAARRAVRVYDAGIARLEDRWAGTGRTGSEFLDEHHPYAGDLDLFGTGSLYELLCTARTEAGERTLASWLLNPASPAEVQARQDAVRELTTRIDLREEVALLGEETRAGVRPQSLADWGTAAPAPIPGWVRWAALALAATVSVTGLAWPLGLGPLPFFLAVVAAMALGSVFAARIDAIVASVDRPARELSVLAALLRRLERESFADPRLRQLVADLSADGGAASARIAELHRLLSLLESRRNQMFALFALLLLWTTQLALAVERWRARCGPHLPRWLAAVGEIEGLLALSGYAYERPEAPFPEVVASAEPSLVAIGLGHPLLARDRVVCNDLKFDRAHRLLLVSGSNMSGKSTLLRTIGTNVVLALAGAPVRATRLRLTPFQLGASIRINDSLAAGESRFYAEIRRIRQIVDLAGGEPPLLYLLDEILHGTNSHDRRAGAAAVVRGLVQRGAVGLVTTHDLALAEIVEELQAVAANVHFEDHLGADGKMSFDYTMRPGVVERSNALALMRAIGLEV